MSWTLVVRMCVVFGLAAAAGTTAEVHRFERDWPDDVQSQLSAREVIALGERTPIEGRPAAFSVHVPSAALVPKLVESVAVAVDGRTESDAATKHRITAVFVVKPAGGTVKDSLRVSMERTRHGNYRTVPEDRESLVKWLLAHIDELAGGAVAVDAVDGLEEGEGPASVVISPPHSG